MIYSFFDFIKQWIEKAESDLISAQILIEHNPLVLDNACFHCQQAAEKYLKVYLIYNKIDITKTHDINYLIGESSKLDSEFSKIEIQNMQDFAVKIRYPHDFLLPTHEEAVQYYKIALSIKTLVISKIKL